MKALKEGAENLYDRTKTNSLLFFNEKDNISSGGSGQTREKKENIAENFHPVKKKLCKGEEKNE